MFWKQNPKAQSFNRPVKPSEPIYVLWTFGSACKQNCHETWSSYNPWHWACMHFVAKEQLNLKMGFLEPCGFLPRRHFFKVGDFWRMPPVDEDFLKAATNDAMKINICRRLSLIYAEKIYNDIVGRQGLSNPLSFPFNRRLLLPLQCTLQAGFMREGNWNKIKPVGKEAMIALYPPPEASDCIEATILPFHI